MLEELVVVISGFNLSKYLHEIFCIQLPTTVGKTDMVQWFVSPDAVFSQFEIIQILYIIIFFVKIYGAWKIMAILWFLHEGLL